MTNFLQSSSFALDCLLFSKLSGCVFVFGSCSALSLDALSFLIVPLWLSGPPGSLALFFWPSGLASGSLVSFGYFRIGPSCDYASNAAFRFRLSVLFVLLVVIAEVFLF